MLMESHAFQKHSADSKRFTNAYLKLINLMWQSVQHLRVFDIIHSWNCKWFRVTRQPIRLTPCIFNCKWVSYSASVAQYLLVLCLIMKFKNKYKLVAAVPYAMSTWRHQLGYINDSIQLNKMNIRWSRNLIYPRKLKHITVLCAIWLIWHASFEINTSRSF